MAACGRVDGRLPLRGGDDAGRPMRPRHVKRGAEVEPMAPIQGQVDERTLPVAEIGSGVANMRAMSRR